ncbi:MAG: hypothetical protein J5545_10920 [Bacteroidaceae bacterium]|nr:hypothetical protein [Bacteroidaceae bacterium]
MATLSNEQIEQLKQQLKEKQEEIREIYDKLVEAGAVEMPDDFLDSVAGGNRPHRPTAITDTNWPKR